MVTDIEIAHGNESSFEPNSELHCFARHVLRIRRKKIVDRIGHSELESLLVPLEKLSRFRRDLDRFDRNRGVGVSRQQTPLAFGKREIGETYPQRDDPANIELVDPEAVSKELSTEMTPAVGEKQIEIMRRDVLGVEDLVDVTEFGGQGFEFRVPSSMFNVQCSMFKVRCSMFNVRG